MRVTEVHPAIRGHGDPGVLGHLLALVPRQCLEQRLRQRLDHLGHQPRHGLGIPAIRQLPHQAEPGPPLDDRDQPTRVVVNDEVTLPMTRHSPVSGDRGSVNQAGTLEPGTIGSAGQLRLRFATGPPRTKCLDHREFVTKTPGSLQIKGLVDRLVRHVQVLPVRVLTAEPTGDLLWGTLIVEPIDDVGTNAWVIKTFAPMLLADLGGRGNGVGGRGTIGGTGPRVGIGIEAVALEFSGHRRVVDPELGGNGPRRQWRVRLHTGLDRHPILERQVAIGTSARRGGRSRADRGRHASQLAKLDRDSQAA